MFWLDIWYGRYSDDRTQTSFVCHTKLLYVSKKKTMNVWNSSHIIPAVLFKFTFYMTLLTIVKTLTSSDPGSRNWLSLRWSSQTVFVLTGPRSLFAFSLESLFSSLPQFSLSVHYQPLVSKHLWHFLKPGFILNIFRKNEVHIFHNSLAQHMHDG